MGTLVQDDRTYEATSDNSVALAFGSNVVSGNLLVVAIGCYHDTATINTPTDTIGTTYVQAGSLLRIAASSLDPMLAVYYGIAPSSGANTVTVGFSASVGDKELKIWEISGVDTTTPLNQTNGATGTSTAAASGNITTTTPGFIIKVLNEWAWTTHDHAAGTPTTGWTEFGDTVNGADSATRNETATGTFNGGFTLGTSTQWCCRIVAFADVPPPSSEATGFPVVGGTVTQTLGTVATTTPVINLPSGIQAGETICVLVRVAVAGAIGWPDGTWNEMFDASSDAADDQMALAWHLATGAEGATITLSSGSGKFAALSWRVTGATDPTVRAPELSTVATGSGTTPNPTACTPTGGAKNYLWVWLGGWEGEQTSPPASNPTDFALNVTGADSGTASTAPTNCRVAVAFRQFNAASQDPGSWTISVTEDWTAYTMAFHPADLPPPTRVIQNAVSHAASW